MYQEKTILEHGVFTFRISLHKNTQCGLLLFRYLYHISFGRLFKHYALRTW